MRTRIAWILTLTSMAAPLLAADETFFDEAARAGMAEVALGKLAAAKASTDRLQAFGRQMVGDHEAANEKLKAAAAKSGVELPTDMAEDAQATHKKLQLLSGGAFDLAYAESQSKAHATTLKLLQKEIASGTDPAAKTWAVDALPMVKRHAEMIGDAGEMPGEHELEHAVGTPGPADAPPVSVPPR